MVTLLSPIKRWTVRKRWPVLVHRNEGGVVLLCRWLASCLCTPVTLIHVTSLDPTSAEEFFVLRSCLWVDGGSSGMAMDLSGLALRFGVGSMEDGGQTDKSVSGGVAGNQVVP